MNTALVTGAGSGIGQAVAHRLSDDGYRVVCADLDLDAAQRVAADLPVADPLQMNVADPKQVGVAFKELGDDVSAVVHAAGILTTNKLRDITADEWNLTVAVNLSGTFFVMQAATAKMADRGGSLVAVASIESVRPARGHAHYAATKAAVRSLVQSFAGEYGRAGVRVNAVAPGVIETPMTHAATANPDTLAAIERTIAARRLGRPDEIAAAVSFLCSSQSTYLNGAFIPVDGGALTYSPL